MRLIGIKLGMCDPLVRKGLKDDTWYPFGQYTEPSEQNGWYWRTKQMEQEDKACCQMYQTMAEDKDESLEITVNCIVGKNGSGKSTLLDILYRIINNFAYSLIDKTWEDNTPEKNPQRGHYLHHANGFEATLYFESDGVLGSIYNCYENVRYSYHSTVDDSRIDNERIEGKISKSKLERIARHLFYAVCTNYSIHSLNELDYTPNRLLMKYNGCNIDGQWIKGLFHKNDGYVVPITMVPYRYEDGNIDINNENHLAKQRLATLAVLFASQNKKFMGTYTPTNITYRFSNNAKGDFSLRFNRLFKQNFCRSNIKCSDLKKELAECWKKNLAGHYSKGFNPLLKNVKDTILIYLAYKTLKTCIHYRKYGELIGIKSLTKEEIKNNQKKRVSDLYLETDVNSIIAVVKEILFNDTKIHINQKIHQLITFIEKGIYITQYLKIPKEAAHLTSEIKNDVAYGWNQMEVGKLYIEETKEKRLIRHPFKTFDEAFRMMPPAIFEWEISFAKDNTGDEGTLSQMSSGERQLMHSISYIIYHIKNIESVTEDNYRVKYHNISLVFDEAELYYHPDYQRSFISNLMKMLSWCHINHNIIRGVNILIATHSPFVLSDIPLANTLYLDDGNVVDKKKETFCGNIHELLGGNFFMNYSIGDVARENVEEIIALYNQSKSEEKPDENKAKYIANAERYDYVAKVIADEYLSKRINAMVRELKAKFGSDTPKVSLEEKIRETREKLEQLERELINQKGRRQ